MMSSKKFKRVSFSNLMEHNSPAGNHRKKDDRFQWKSSSRREMSDTVNESSFIQFRKRFWSRNLECPYSCNLCKSSFRDDFSLHLHFEEHLRDKFLLTFSRFRFSIPGSVMPRQETENRLSSESNVTRQQPSPTDPADEAVRSTTSIDIEKEPVKPPEIRRYTCYCGKLFVSLEDLLEHHKSIHRNDATHSSESSSSQQQSRDTSESLSSFIQSGDHYTSHVNVSLDENEKRTTAKPQGVEQQKRRQLLLREQQSRPLSSASDTIERTVVAKKREICGQMEVGPTKVQKRSTISVTTVRRPKIMNVEEVPSKTNETDIPDVIELSDDDDEEDDSTSNYDGPKTALEQKSGTNLSLDKRSATLTYQTSSENDVIESTTCTEDSLSKNSNSLMLLQGRRHVCGICGCQFKMKKFLQLHLKTVHDEP